MTATGVFNPMVQSVKSLIMTEHDKVADYSSWRKRLALRHAFSLAEFSQASY